MKKVEVNIYTDGAASGNPGPGGYGIIMEWAGTGYQKEFSEGYKYTTNNRMELLAVIVALKKLKRLGTCVRIYTDATYVQKAVQKGWVFQWERTGFKGKKNADLWRDFLIAYRKHHVTLIWVRGHNHHRENERCDQLAVEARKKEHLLEDVGYETPQKRLL